MSEVKSGFECGIGLQNYNDLKVGDMIEVFDGTSRSNRLTAGPKNRTRPTDRRDPLPAPIGTGLAL